MGWGRRWVIPACVLLVATQAVGEGLRPDGRAPSPPRVIRDGGSPVGIHPGTGTFTIEGPERTVRIAFGPEAPASLADVSEAVALDVARSFAGLPAARAHLRPVSLGPDGANRLGWAVDLFDTPSLTAVRVYVDAEGHPAGAISLVRSGLARVWGRSPDHGGLREVRLAGLGEGARLASDILQVDGCAGEDGPVCERHGFARPDDAGDWLFDPVRSDPFDPFTEVNAWYHLHDARRRLAEIGLDDYPQQVLAVVNFRLDLTGDGRLDPYPNAFFFPRMTPDADGLVFGHLGAGGLAHDTDVLRHELVHAATVHLAELHARFDEQGFDHQPWVVAESVADYFAAALSGDPAIGVHAGGLLGLGPDGVRRLDRALDCPADLVGQPHADAEVFGGALWRAREAVGEEMDVVVAAALRAMPHQPTLAQAARAVEAVASAVLPADEAARVSAVLAAAGLLDCSRFRLLTGAAPRQGWLAVTRQMGRLSPGPFQYRIPIPEGTGRVRVVLEPERSADAAPVLHVRVGAPVQYLRREVAGRLTYEIVADAEGKAEIVLESGDWRFMESPVLFASPANAADHGWAYRIRVVYEPEATGRIGGWARPDLGEQPPPRPVPANDGAAPTGCVLGPVGLLVLLAGLRRRRAR